jgi:hypothetical protein
MILEPLATAAKTHTNIDEMQQVSLKLCVAS